MLGAQASRLPLMKEQAGRLRTQLNSWSSKDPRAR